MEKHAPGPLTVRGPSLGTGQYDDGGDYGIYDSEGIIVGEAYYKVGVEMFRLAEANARLWAAAPDMLEACQAENTFWEHIADCLYCLTLHEWEFNGRRFCATGRDLQREARRLRVAAIAKAKGEPADATN